MKVEREGKVGFSGRWPKVFHAVREEYPAHSLCSSFTKLDFYYDFDEMPQVNESWGTSLTPCTSCFTKTEEANK